MKKIFIIVVLVLLVTLSFAQLKTFAAVRWEFTKKIRVYIPEHEDSDLMKKSFEEWAKFTDDKMRFYYVPRANSADIEVRFVEKIEEPLSDLTIGLTRTTKYGESINHAVIWIADKTLDDKVLNQDIRYVVMVHEVGHAIGLKHSSDNKSVMFPGANAKMEITPTDIAKLKQIYNWK